LLFLSYLLYTALLFVFLGNGEDLSLGAGAAATGAGAGAGAAAAAPPSSAWSFSSDDFNTVTPAALCLGIDEATDLLLDCNKAEDGTGPAIGKNAFT
jgi:hypothetical protein